MSTPEHRRIIITGTAGALGSVVAARFLEAGCEVIGLDLSYEHEDLAQDDASEQFFTLKLDATDAEAVRTQLNKVRTERGPIDSLVHCAGGFRWSKFEELSDADLDFLLNVNLRSTMLMVRGVVGEMKAEDFGRVVLVSSRSTLNPGVGEGAYAATKAGINAIVKAVAAEVAADNVTINAVLPAIIDTPANREAMPDADFETWVTREQLAEIIFELVHGAMGEAINGALIPVSGKIV